MSTKLPEITFVPYQQAGEPPRRAAFIPVEFILDNLSDHDFQIAGHLIDAVNAINPIYRDQFEPKTTAIRRLMRSLITLATGKERQQLMDYLSILELQNGPYSFLPRKNHLIGVPADRLRSLAKQAGESALADLEQVLDLLTEEKITPDKANFYPPDLSDDEYSALGKEANIVNSSVIRDPYGKPLVLRNEARYRKVLYPVIQHLRAARDLATDPGFRLYLDAKIVELESGSEESRRVADFAWIRHQSPIDIVISTGLEVYLDNYKNARGAATGGVYLRNPAGETLLRALIDRVPRFEATAPWTHKKEAIDPETLPKLKYVDVLAWAGDYIGSPNTTLAQSLPNDQWVAKNIGTVNMVYMNTTRAIHQVAGQMIAAEFLPGAEIKRLKDLLFESAQLHSALHEIGHTTGRMDPEHNQGQPGDYLEEEYSWLEESRAELFGLWSLKLLVEDGVIEKEMARACYDAFLLTMITGLRFDPAQAHVKARNAIFHYFSEHGVVDKIEEGGKTRFAIAHDKAHSVTSKLLKIVGDLKAAGDKDGVAGLREAYIYVDPMKEELDQRMADIPLGRGLIFPQLKQEKGRYLRELIYPEDFSSQPKFNLKFP